MAAAAYRTSGPCTHRPPAGHAHPDPGRPRAAVRPGPRPVTAPACVTTATSWNVTPGPINHRIPPPVKDLAVPGHDRGPSRWHIPAVAGVAYQQRRSGRPESDKAPPCMRWRGRARPRRAGWPVAWSSPSAARRPPGPGTRARGRSPGSSRVPGVAPGWCPFPAVKALLLPPQAPRKTLQQAISCFSAIHGRLHREQAVIRIPPRLSTGFSQPIHRFPSVSRRTPQPAVPNARCYVTS